MFSSDGMVHVLGGHKSSCMHTIAWLLCTCTCARYVQYMQHAHGSVVLSDHAIKTVATCGEGADALQRRIKLYHLCCVSMHGRAIVYMYYECYYKLLATLGDRILNPYNYYM